MGSVEDAERWEDIAARKRAQRERLIPAEWRIPTALLPPADIWDVSRVAEESALFTPHELTLTNATASEVVARIAGGEWTSEEVTKAVCKRAAIAQQLVNCLTEICFDEALARAKVLDEKLRKDGKPVGPLHGLPISLKDQFNVPGLDTTMGYISRAGKSVGTASTLVEILLRAGAVIYVKTNVPATLMMGETVNNLFGRTLNPFNRTLTPSGSSGGEAALIGFRGSYLGVGTDIGGSIRHPCLCAGLYGLRPSHGRVSYQQVANTLLGQEAVRSSVGPMCRSATDIRLFMTSVLEQEPWRLDPQCLPIPWRSEEENLPEQLCFGLGIGDGVVRPTPPMLRALEIVRDKLTAAGHKVIEYIPHESPEAHGIVYQMWEADGGEEFQRDTDLSGEPLHPFLESWLGHSAKAKKWTVFETWQNQHRRTLLAQRWLERWEATKQVTGTGRPIDGLIMPSLAFPAVKHDSAYPSQYGGLAPLLDLTTGSFPVTKVDMEKDVVPADWKPISEKDREVIEFYGGPKNHEGAMVGLTVIARRLEEEKVTAMLQLMEDVVGVDY